MAAPDLSGQKLGQYDLITDLGTGVYTRTYLAFQPRLRRHVAVKILLIDPQNPDRFLEHFEQMAQAIAQLNHPNIVSMYDFGQARGLAYLVMQSVTGGTFRARLGKPLAVSEAVSPIIQLAGALHHAHQRGVLHLNISPANILIDQENLTHLLLTDFSLNELYRPIHLAQTGLPPGTPAYLAPEQIEGEPPDARADVYALSALLFEALAGQPPFTGTSPAIVLNKHLHELPPYIRGFNPAVPRELAQIVARAMSRHPAERYPSAEAFAHALEPYQDTRDRQYRLTLTLEDLNLPDDDPEPGFPPHPADPSAQARPQPGAPARVPHQENRLAQQEFSAIRSTRPSPEAAISLVPALGTKLLRQVLRLAGHGPAAQRLERIASNPLAQMTAGIASIVLTLTLALSLTLLAVAPPTGAVVRQARGGLGLSNPTPTATLAPRPPATATSIPTTTANPGGPAIDPSAAAVLSQMTAALGVESDCQSNQSGARLPAGRVYLTLCFQSDRIPDGGTASFAIYQRGDASPIFQRSSPVAGDTRYQWFWFTLDSPGSYSIEIFWNGALARIYPLTIN